MCAADVNEGGGGMAGLLIVAVVSLHMRRRVCDCAWSIHLTWPACEATVDTWTPSPSPPDSDTVGDPLTTAVHRN